jgi:Family of unknown function (DUF6353)
MTLSQFAHKIEKLVIDNSPTILTAIAVTGTLSTVYLTGKATFKAAKLIEAEQTILDGIVKPKTKMGHITHQMDTWEKTQLVWKFYIPAAGTCVLTLTAMVGANHIGHRRAAALAAAFSISEKAFAEYKDKVIEVAGKAKEQKARDDMAQDVITRTPIGSVYVTGSGEVLCYDAFTGRYFMSSMEALKKAQNDTNYQVNNNMYASLSDFYNHLGLPTTSYSDEVGWNSDKLLECEYSTCMSEDGRPCISINFAVVPVRDYYRVH